MKPVPTRLTTGQVAKFSSVHINVVKKWIAEGLLAAYRLPAGHFRIETKEYLRFLEQTGMPRPEELLKETPDLKQKKVLIVDDDEEQLLLIEKFLNALGFPTAKATDGHLGLIQVGAFNPDLVLLDINMPRANGFDLLNALNKQPSNPEIIVMTGEQTPTTNKRLTSYSVRAVLHKPFPLTDLRQAVSHLLPENH